VAAAPSEDHDSARQRFAEALHRQAERARAELRREAEQARAGLRQAAEADRAYDEKLDELDIERERWEAMNHAFDQEQADMARRLENRSTPPTPASAILSGLVATLVGAARALEVAYDGDPGGIVYGTPAQARAFRALRNDGDARHFLLVEGHGGEDALLLDLLKLLPVDEFAERVLAEDADRDHPEARALAEAPSVSAEDVAGDSSFKSLDILTIPELHAWRDRWVSAAYQVADYLAGRTRAAELAALSHGEEIDKSAEAAQAATLTPAELLLMFAVGEAPRGFAGGDERVYQDVQTLRARLRRRLEKPSRSVSE